jgi:hypothetical protein
VLVVENPRVLEAVADADLEVAVVCGNGNPNNVAIDVLHSLAGCGAVLVITRTSTGRAGDRQPAGARAVAVQPWAVPSEDYLAAPSGVPLPEWPIEAGSDPALTVAITARASPYTRRLPA